MILNPKLILYGVLAVGIGSGVLYIKHQFDLRDRYEARATKAESDLKSRIENEKHDQQVIEVYHEAEEKIVYVDRIVTKEVIKYRDANPVRCTLPADFVRIYNQSIDPRTAIGADDKVKAP